MKRLLLTVLPLLLVVGCSSPEPINFNEVLNLRDQTFYTKDTNQPYTGPVFSIRSDGSKESEGNLKDGKLDGEWIEYYSSGQILIKENYKNGVKDGSYSFWYENGNKRVETTFSDNKYDGLHNLYFNNGSKRQEMTYKDGKENGTWKMWSEDQELEIEGTFLNGIGVGLFVSGDNSVIFDTTEIKLQGIYDICRYFGLSDPEDPLD